MKFNFIFYSSCPGRLSCRSTTATRLRQAWRGKPLRLGVPRDILGRCGRDTKQVRMMSIMWGVSDGSGTQTLPSTSATLIPRWTRSCYGSSSSSVDRSRTCPSPGTGSIVEGQTLVASSFSELLDPIRDTGSSNSRIPMMPTMLLRL